MFSVLIGAVVPFLVTGIVIFLRSQDSGELFEIGVAGA